MRVDPTYRGGGGVQGVSDKDWLDKLVVLVFEAEDKETLVRLVQFIMTANTALFGEYTAHVGRMQGQLSRLAHYVRAHPYGEKHEDR